MTLPAIPPPFEMLVDPKTGVINEIWYRWISSFSDSLTTAIEASLASYETGSWTPAYDPLTGAFTSVTYDGDVWGRYTKIGNMVAFQCRLQTDAITVGTASDDLRISGLPYAARTQTEGYQSVAVGYAASFTGEEPISGIIPSATQLIALYYRAAVDGNSAASKVSDLNTGANDNLLYVGGIYFTA